MKLRPKTKSSAFKSGLGWDVLLTTTWEGSMSWSLLWEATSGLMLYWRVA